MTIRMTLGMVLLLMMASAAVAVQIPLEGGVTACSLRVDGEQIRPMEAFCINFNGRVHAPLRFIAERLDCQVDFDAVNRWVAITTSRESPRVDWNDSLQRMTEWLTRQNPDVLEIRLNTYPIGYGPDYLGATFNGRTYLPVRVIAEALGCSVIWDDINKEALVYTNLWRATDANRR